MLAATQPQAIGGILNIATQKQTSINELIDLVQQVTEKEVPVIHTEPRAGEIRYSQANIEKPQKILGYNQRTNLKEGLLLTWEEVTK